MKKLTGHELRKMWLDFFEERGHKIEESASLVPINDPSLLWINAGVAPLKGYFDGTRIPKNPRIANAQKCIRTNDIENVGKTARHHTFFEMLGNFSIGDYFRDDIIPWAYELLTSPKYFDMDVNKLYITVYPTDQETKEAWLKVGIKEDHIIESEHNFWEIGSGPCGPDTEIYYDRGSGFGEGDLTLIKDDIENDRFVEVWNIVFSQYNAKPNLTREEYPELPKKNIDTGMGLERMACLSQETETNFETDLIYPVIKHISRIAKKPYGGELSFKVIADHIRSVTFAVSDGATLSNDGRGYVLRRLLRRAIKHGRQLGIDKPFLKDLVDTVITMMEESYPSLRKTETFVKQVIEKEELKFLETLNQGEKMLESLIASSDKVIKGEDAFKLYDTYGFPIELTEEYAEQAGIKVDRRGFNIEMQAQKDRARSARKTMRTMKDQNEAYLNFTTPSTFVGYDTLTKETQVIKVFEEGIVTKETPFYAESGGQVSDQGVIMKNGHTYDVIDVEKLPNKQHLHVIEHHNLKEGDTVTMRVDETSRHLTMAHHSATHLLYKTLREKLGSHISQQGSLVGPDYLRFDFNHFELITDHDLLAIEASVNDKIRKAYDVDVQETTVDAAKEQGAIAEFGEKYDAEVRLIDMGETLDLCGGTHVHNTADIERFSIASLESKGSGVYRITALAKDKVFDIENHMKGLDENIEHLKEKAETILKQANNQNISLTFKLPEPNKIVGSYQDIINKRQYFKTLQKAVKTLEKSYQDAKENASLEDLKHYLNQAKDGKILLKTHDIDPKALKTLTDRLMEHLNEGTIFIVNKLKDKLILIAKTTDQSVHAGKLVKAAAQVAGGNGGGRPDFAQAGATDISKTDDIIAFVERELA